MVDLSNIDVQSNGHYLLAGIAEKPQVQIS